MFAKVFSVFVASLLCIVHAISVDDTYFEIGEKHGKLDTELQVPQNPNSFKGSKARVRQNLVDKLLAIIKDRPSERSEDNLISGPEVLGIRDLLLEEKYKTRGAVSMAKENDDNEQIELEGFDKLFTQDGEKHTYDERGHREMRIQIRR